MPFRIVCVIEMEIVNGNMYIVQLTSGWILTLIFFFVWSKV